MFLHYRFLFYLLQSKQTRTGSGRSGRANGSSDRRKSDKTYRAQITSLNESANQNRNVSGNITLTVQGDQLQISVEAIGLEPNMMHLQHLHGSKEGDEINCPDSDADNNDDELVDITEAYDVAGVTMIPFHDNPPNMEVDTQTYPMADENGNISYQ